MKKLSVFLVCLILLAIGGVAFAQAPEDLNIFGYFVAVNNQPAGPYDATGLRQLISDGRLNRETLVWREGMNDWAPAGRVAELSPLMASVPPPLPMAHAPLAPAPYAPAPAATPVASTVSSPSEQSSFSVGGGLIWDWSLNNNGFTTTIYGSSTYMGFRNMTIGGFVFFDATFMELSFHIGPALIAGVVDMPGAGKVVSDMEIDGLQLGISILGKYPFNVGPVILFPLLGLDVNLYTFEIAASQLGFLAGAGCDFFFTDSLYIRAEGLFSFRLPAFDFWVEFFEFNDYIKFSFGKGPRVKVGVGFVF